MKAGNARWALAVLSVFAAGRIWGAGTSGANLLKVSAGARGLAMASAQTALSGDLAPLLANPSLLGAVGRRSIMLMHWPGIADMQTEFLSYSLPVSKMGMWAATVLFRSFPAIDNGVPGEAPVEVNDGMIMMTFARGAGKRKTNLGASLKLFNSTIGDAKATSMALDLGAFGKPAGLKYINYGVGVTNLGAPIKHESVGEPLPLAIRTGASYSRKFDPHYLTVASDMQINLEQDLRLGIGAEWLQAGHLALRAGCWYQRFAPRNFTFPGNFTFGAGWRFRSVMLGPEAEYSLDYAYLPFTLLSQYMPTHAFSVFIKF